jgi:hypothetical protein
MENLIAEYKKLILQYLTVEKYESELDKKTQYNFLRGFSFALKLQGFTEAQDKELINQIHKENESTRKNA